MPRIPDQFLRCVFYLYPDAEAAESGRRAGGSGFIVCLPPHQDLDGGHLYAVTNRHLVRYRNTVLRLNSDDGTFDVLPTAVSEWFFEPHNDLAVCPLEFSQQAIACVTPEIFISREKIEQEAIGPGDDVFMVGRFINHEGIQRNTPAVRFGNIAMMPNEPVNHPSVEGGKQESFVVEMRSISGYSGSPVFVYQQPSLSPRPNWQEGDDLVHWFGPFLLGVEWGYINDFSDAMPGERRVLCRNGEPHPEGLRVASNTGMAGVVPAWRLLELLNTPVLVREREESEQQFVAAMNRGGTGLS